MQSNSVNTSGQYLSYMPNQLFTLPSEKNKPFRSNMALLAGALHVDNAFVFILASKKLSLYGDRVQPEFVHYHALANYLNTLPAHSELFDTPVSSIFTSSQYSLYVTLAKYSDGTPAAVFGTYLPIEKVPTERQKSMASLIFEDFNVQFQLRTKVSELNKQQSRHIQISELNQDYICVKNEKHEIVYANKAMLDSFSKQKHSGIVGSNDAFYYDPDSSAQVIHSDLCALAKGQYSCNEHLVLLNGEEKIFHTDKTTFVGVDGKLYILSVSRDVTEKEILIKDLERSNDDLDNFAYVASHDLKSPLNVIKRLVTWVRKDCDKILPDESKDDLQLVLSRVERMEKLLHDLLSYSRIGKDYQESNDTNVQQVVRELLALIDLPMGFVVNCDDTNIHVPEVPFNVVMLNLINNAIKHHDSSNAKIEVKVKRSSKGAVVTVADDGPGISEENRERIFKLFETLRSRDEVEGSGMGLSVVKKIVQHYGGEVHVEHNQPRGAKFVVNWPTSNMARSVLNGLNS